MAQAHAKAPVTAAKAPAQGGPPRQTAVAQRSGNQAVATRPTGVSGAISGWWGGATKWANEKLDAAGKAVQQTWDGTKQFARDVGDVVRTTSVSAKGGRLAVQTDLDEVLDLMPEKVRKAVQLDKTNPAANRADIGYDTRSGKLTVSVPDLQVKSVDTPTVKSGPARVQGAVLTMDDAGARARDAVKGTAGETVAGWVFGKEAPATAKAPPARTQLTVAKASASDVRVTDASGKVTAGARYIDVSGVDASVEAGTPATGGRETARGWLNVANATANGAHGAGATAEELSVQGVAAHVGEDGETGSIGAERIAARGVVKDGEALGAGELRDVRSTFTNAGGGVPVADARPDVDLRTQGTVGSASVQDARTRAGGVGAASASGLAWTQGRGTARASAGALDLDAVDTDAVDVQQVSGAGLHVSQDATGTRAGATRLEARGLDTESADAATLNLRNLALARTAAGTRAQVSSVDATGLSTSGGSARDVRATQVDAAQDAGGMSVTAGTAHVGGLDTAALDADALSARNLAVQKTTDGATLRTDALAGRGLAAAGSRIATVDAAGVSAHQGGDGTRLAVADVRATGIDTPSVDVATANARNLALQRGANTTLRADSAGATGVVSAQGRVGAITGTELAAATRDGGTTLRAGAVNASDVDTAAVDARTVGATGIDVSLAEQNRARVAALSATGVRGAGHAVDALSARDLDAQGSRAGGSVSLASAEASGVTGPNAVDRVQVDGLQASADANARRTQGAVASLKAEGIDTEKVDAASASLEGLSWDVSPEKASAKLGGADVSRLRGPVGTGVDAASVRDAGVSFDAGREAGVAHLGELRARGIEAAGTKVASVQASEIIGQLENTGGGIPMLDAKPDRLEGAARARSAEAAGVDGKIVDVGRVKGEHVVVAARQGSLQASVDEAKGEDVRVAHPGLDLTMQRAEVKAGQATLGTEGIDAGADLLRAQGARFDARFGSGGSQTGAQAATADAPALDVLGLARRIDNADIQASVPLNPGKLGPAEVEPGTRANVRARVQGGAIDAANTGVRMDKPLDGPLWTEVNGVYLEPGRDGLRAKADVAGFVDVDVSKGLGGPLPSRVDGLVDRVAATTAAGASTQGAATASPIDVKGIQASGSAQLAPGTLDMGAVRADLLRQRADDNAVQFKADGSGSLGLKFGRLLTGDVSIQNAAQTTTLDGMATFGAAIDVTQDASGQHAKGAADSVEIRGVSTKPRK